MESSLYIAVDLGAGSGRIFLAGVDPGELLLEEIHRFQYPPTEENGHLRWNFPQIFSEIRTGLRKAAVRSNELGRTVCSIGIDSWAVDYGLIDADGQLIANPVCYRDDRTIGAMDSVFTKVSRSTIFEKTGIQFQNFNTLFQLYSEDGNLKKAAKLLLLPDLINYFLTGKTAAERTNATTTQMVSAASGKWDRDLLEKLDLPADILPEIIPTGSDLGLLKPEIATGLGLPDVRVVAPATHDTASAIAGAPLLADHAYISSGTWSLIGVERDDMLTDRETARQNFTNTGGAYEKICFLKNVMGLWIFESCRREWQARGIDIEYDAIIAEVAEKSEFKAFIFPDDERFLNPPSMLGAIEQQMTETGNLFNSDPASVAKVIFDSLAFRYASVLRNIESLTSRKLKGVEILGGGGRNGYLNQMTANAIGLTIRAGLTEAAVVGNVLVQAITAGRFSSIATAREHVRANFELTSVLPQPSSKIDEAAERYAAVENKFIA